MSEDGILVVEWVINDLQHTTLALTWTRQVVGEARFNQSAGYAKPELTFSFFFYLFIKSLFLLLISKYLYYQKSKICELEGGS